MTIPPFLLFSSIIPNMVIVSQPCSLNLLYHSGQNITMVQEVKRMDQLLIEIGDRIRRRRKQLGLTQEDLSNRTDVTTQTISNAELGLKGMRPDTIIRICRALEISTDYLLLGEIGDSDKSLFSERLATLTPNQMKHLIDIVDSYLTAIQEKEA